MDISSGHLTNSHSCKDKEEPVGAPNKGTTFVNVIGRPISDTVKDGNVAEGGMVANLSLELSSVEIHKDSHVEAARSDRSWNVVNVT